MKALFPPQLFNLVLNLARQLTCTGLIKKMSLVTTVLRALVFWVLTQCLNYCNNLYVCWSISYAGGQSLPSGSYLVFGSDTDDILRVQTDMCRRANYLLSTFSATNPAVKTLLFRTFYLSLYGSSLWSLVSPGLHSLEVTFNNILRKIWNLPRNCHTSILHCVSTLQGLHKVVIQCSDAVSQS